MDYGPDLAELLRTFDNRSNEWFQQVTSLKLVESDGADLEIILSKFTALKSFSLSYFPSLRQSEIEAIILPKTLKHFEYVAGRQSCPREATYEILLSKRSWSLDSLSLHRTTISSLAFKILPLNQ